MAASLKCSEKLPDTREESTLDCVFFFDQNILQGSQSSLLDGCKARASYIHSANIGSKRICGCSESVFSYFSTLGVS